MELEVCVMPNWDTSASDKYLRPGLLLVYRKPCDAFAVVYEGPLAVMAAGVKFNRGRSVIVLDAHRSIDRFLSGGGSRLSIRTIEEAVPFARAYGRAMVAQLEGLPAEFKAGEESLLLEAGWHKTESGGLFHPEFAGQFVAPVTRKDHMELAMRRIRVRQPMPQLIF